MAQQVEVKKTIEVQVDYVRCRNCGEHLLFDIYSDNYGDIQIDVDKCECSDD